jgi:lambda family phage portal protein
MTRIKSVDRTHISLSEAYAELRQSYKASSTTRFQHRRTGIHPLGTSGDFHLGTDRDYFFIVELCRDLERNDAVISQAVRRLVANVLQDGFTVDPNTGDEELDRDLKAMWNEWTSDADQVTTSQEWTWHELEKLLFYQTLIDGDIFAVLTNRGSIEVLESHRCRTPRTAKNVVHGVLLDQLRRRLEYWFTKENIESWRAAQFRVSDMRQVPTRDRRGFRQVLQLYNPKRWSQTRGMSILHPVVDIIGMFDDVNFAKLVQAQAVSAWCILRERAPGFKSTRKEKVDNKNFALPQTLEGTLKGIAAGMEVAAPPGETIKGFSPGVPNPEYFAHANLILNIIAINLDQPVAVFMLDPSKTNFSGWRGAVDQARLAWQWWQQWYSNRLHRPTYLWKLRQWIAGDAVLRAQSERSDVQIYRHGWHRPRWPYIEPMTDASADLLRDRNGQTSKRRLHAEKGIEWNELAREIVEDNAIAIRLAKTAAQEINTEFDDDAPVHWRELISLPTPDGMAISLATGDDGPDQAAREGEAADG